MLLLLGGGGRRRVRLLSGGALSGLLTFSRASPAYAETPPGTVQSYAANVPRLIYDSALSPIGTLFEGQRANLCFPSTPGSGWGVGGTNISIAPVAGPDGSPAAAVAINPKLFGIYDETNLVWVPGVGVNTPYPEPVTSTRWTRQRLTFTAPAGCTSARCILARTSDAASQINKSIAVVPNTIYTWSFYTRQSADGLALYIWGAQLEASEDATSVIPTTTTSGTRAEERALGTLGPWFNQREGTIIAAFVVPPTRSTSQYVWEVDVGQSIGNRICLRLNNGLVRARIDADGSNKLEMSAGTALSPGSLARVAFAWKNGDQAVSVNGGAVAAGLAYIPTAPLDTITVGSAPGSLNNLNAPLRNLTYYPKRLPNALLQSLTSA